MPRNSCVDFFSWIFKNLFIYCTTFVSDGCVKTFNFYFVSVSYFVHIWKTVRSKSSLLDWLSKNVININGLSVNEEKIERKLWKLKKISSKNSSHWGKFYHFPFLSFIWEKRHREEKSIFESSIYLKFLLRECVFFSGCWCEIEFENDFWSKFNLIEKKNVFMCQWKNNENYCFFRKMIR